MFPSFLTQVPYQQMVMNSLDTFVELVVYVYSLEGMVLDKSCKIRGS